jgi:dienelactone hydrolase
MDTLRSRGSVALVILLCSVAGACAHQQQPANSSGTTAATSATLSSTEPPAEVIQIETHEVEYATPTTKLKGFIAYPGSVDGKRPAVLVVHEWWGLNEYARKRAAQLAELGYVALAVDMYGDGKQTTHPDDAKKFMTEMMSNMPEAVRRFEAARELLAKNPRVDADKIAAIGYCMGGAVVLHMVRIGEDLDAVASFHGNLASQATMTPGSFRGKILIAQGGADPFVPPDQLAAFEKEMQTASASYEVKIYPNAKHGFTNPDATAIGEKYNLPLAYDAEADKDSWQRLQDLLAATWPKP